MSFGRNALAVLLITSLASLVAKLLLFFGSNHRVYNFVPGECSHVTLSDDDPGAVDFATLNDTVVFAVETASKKGSLFKYDARNRSAHQFALLGKKNSLDEFHPGGLSLFRNRIFIINHRRDGDVVELIDMDLDKGRATHKATIRSKKFQGLRDVAAISGKKFFASIWQPEENEFFRFTREFTGRDIGALVFFDGKYTKYVERNIRSPAGMIYETINERLYVASEGALSILVYSVSSTSSIRMIKEIPLLSAPSLMWLGSDRSLIVAAQPIRVRSLLHRINTTTNYTPSQILRVHTIGNISEEQRIDELYVNDGATVSGATAVVVSGGSLILGSPGQPILSCHLPPWLSFQL